MSAPVNYYPPMERRAAPGNPTAVGTLYSAATVTALAEPSRVEGGARIEQVNCGEAYGTWPLVCPPPEDAGEMGGARAGALEFEALGVWAADACSLVGTTEQVARELAVQRLRLTEELAVSEAFAERLLDDAGVAATSIAGGIVGAVGVMEQALGETGMPGVIHAARHHLAYAADKGLIVRGQGGRLETPGGNVWAFGTGYAGLGETLVGTGPVTILRNDVQVDVGMNHGQNERTAVAQRAVLATYECAAIAVEV